MHVVVMVSEFLGVTCEHILAVRSNPQTEPRRRQAKVLCCGNPAYSSASPLPPHCIDNRPASLMSHLLRQGLNHRVPPFIYAPYPTDGGGTPSAPFQNNYFPSLLWRRSTQVGGATPFLDGSCQCHAKLADRIMWPSPDCQVFSRDHLAMQNQPHEEFAFGLQECLPYLGWD